MHNEMQHWHTQTIMSCWNTQTVTNCWDSWNRNNYPVVGMFYTIKKVLLETFSSYWGDTEWRVRIVL